MATIERYKPNPVSWMNRENDFLVNGRVMVPVNRAYIEGHTSLHTLWIGAREGYLGVYRIRGKRFDYIALDEVVALLTGIKEKRIALPKGVRYYADPELRSAVLQRDKMLCRYCGKDLSNGIPHIDHVLPFLRGGATCLGNLVTACRRCNTRKANRTPEEAGMRLLTLV